jgi:predicted metal-dependent hydrolase
VGGHYLERVFFMLATTVVFQLYALLHRLCFMWVDGVLLSRRAREELRAGVQDMGGRQALLRDYLAYYRPDFHPSRLDARTELGRFRGELASSPIYAAAAR